MLKNDYGTQKRVTTVPKLSARKKLIDEKRMKNIFVYPNQSPQQIHKMIVKAFGICEYTVLDCNGRRNTLTVADNQKIDANALRKRRGSLYLCEKAMEVCLYS